jgi:hypothetical protein
VKSSRSEVGVVGSTYEDPVMYTNRPCIKPHAPNVRDLGKPPISLQRSGKPERRQAHKSKWHRVITPEMAVVLGH